MARKPQSFQPALNRPCAMCGAVPGIYEERVLCSRITFRDEALLRVNASGHIPRVTNWTPASDTYVVWAICSCGNSWPLHGAKSVDAMVDAAKEYKP
jgi:ribosomal protein S14